ncbi:MAG: phage major capsid protein [Phycisphaerae bacterium]|nr:phage major capsid protein [Phycisphaerae bacterium]
MTWIKLLKPYDHHAIGEVINLDDAEAKALIRTGHAESVDAPENADESAIQSLVARTVDQAVDDLLRRRTNETDRRPRITVAADNELSDPRDGFRGVGDFARSVRRAFENHGIDQRLQRRLKATGASEGVNADGGYAVPIEFAQNVFNDILGEDSLFNRCFQIPMTSSSIKLPALNYTTQGSYGVTAYWTSEGAAITTSKPTYRQPQLNLNKLAALVPVTSELLEDGIAIEPIITKLAAEAITFRLNDAIINGDGAGKPTGIIGHASVVSVAKETGQTAATVVAQNIVKMRARFNGNPAHAVWLIHRDVEPQFLTMQDAGGRWLYFAPGSFADNPQGRLLGADVVPLMNCQTPGTVGDVVYADMQQYAIGFKASGPQQAMSLHLYFNTDELAYRWTFRVDGRPWRDAPLAAKNGSSSYSPFVTMAARA